MLPSWLLPTAAVTAVVSYLGWTAAASGGAYTGQGALTLAAATLFWLSIMALVAYAVQRGVQRRSGRR